MTALDTDDCGKDTGTLRETGGKSSGSCLILVNAFPGNGISVLKSALFSRRKVIGSDLMDTGGGVGEGIALGTLVAGSITVCKRPFWIVAVDTNLEGINFVLDSDTPNFRGWGTMTCNGR